MFVLTEFFLVSVVAFSAFLILGLTGFGSALVMIPILSLFLDIKLVVPSALVLHGIILWVFAFRSRKLVEKRLLPLVLLGSSIGVVFGTYVLATYESLLVKKVFGIVVMLFALNMFFEGEKKVLRLGSQVGFFAGLVSGVISALFGMGGPPVVIYFGHQIRKKENIRATLLCYFFLINLWSVTTYFYTGLINLDVLTTSVFLLPSSILGMIVGSRTHSSISQILFRRILAVALLVTGFLNIILV